jgi:hypothetical protein
VSSASAGDTAITGAEYMSAGMSGIMRASVLVVIPDKPASKNISARLLKIIADSTDLMDYENTPVKAGWLGVLGE